MHQLRQAVPDSLVLRCNTLRRHNSVLKQPKQVEHFVKVFIEWSPICPNHRYLNAHDMAHIGIRNPPLDVHTIKRCRMTQVHKRVGFYKLDLRVSSAVKPAVKPALWPLTSHCVYKIRHLSPPPQPAFPGDHDRLVAWLHWTDRSKV